MLGRDFVFFFFKVNGLLFCFFFFFPYPPLFLVDVLFFVMRGREREREDVVRARSPFVEEIVLRML